MKGYKTVDNYIRGPDQWRDELAQLQSAQSNQEDLADNPVGNRSERQVPLLGRERKQGNDYSDDCREDHQQNHVLPVLHRF